MIFPAGISLASTYLGRATISRTGLYLVSTTVVLYLVYIAVFYAIAETLHGGFAISKPNPAAAVQVRSLTPNLFVFYSKPLLVFLALAIPIVFCLNRLFR